MKVVVQFFLLQQAISSVYSTFTESHPFPQIATLAFPIDQSALPVTRKDGGIVPASTPLPGDMTLTSPSTDPGELVASTTEIRNAVSHEKPELVDSALSLETRIFEKEETSTNAKTLSIEMEHTTSEPVTSSGSRRSRSDLYFCCSKDNTQQMTLGQERERNTRPPAFKKKKKSFIPPGPHSERRPALLVRFFPDGTAVLISKFQVYLHVKPKQISFDGDEPETSPERGKSYEVTYKHLESLPLSSKLEDAEYPEERIIEDVYEEHNVDEDHHKDHVIISTTSATVDTKMKHTNLRLSKTLLEPLISTTPTVTSATVTGVDKKGISEISVEIPSDVLNPTISSGTEETSPLQGHEKTMPTVTGSTSTSDPNLFLTGAGTTEISFIASLNATDASTVTDAPNITNIPISEDVKCLNFRNQLSLSLSSEDNISDTLLKKHLLPLSECRVATDKSVSKSSQAKLEKLSATSAESTAGPISEPSKVTMVTNVVTTTSHPSVRTESLPVPHQLQVPNTSAASRATTVSDAVVVTSVPMMIQTKPRDHQSATSHPAWREVTVGVVRNQQGQPLKPPKASYNNWESHLRGIKKRTQSNELWKETTASGISRAIRPSNQRLPIYLQPQRIHQNIQQSTNHGRHSFWSQHPGGPVIDRVRNDNNLFHRVRDTITQTSNKQLYFEKPVVVSNFAIAPTGSTSYHRGRQTTLLGQNVPENQRQRFGSLDRNMNRPLPPGGTMNNQNVQAGPQRNWSLRSRFHGKHLW